MKEEAAQIQTTTRDFTWRLIETAPTDGRQVLACFKGQFSWVIFTAAAAPQSGGGVWAPGHATPTHWMPIPEPPHEG